MVRRGGYDKAAVDQRVQQLLSEKSGLAAGLASSEERVIELEAELERLQAQLAEAQREARDALERTHRTYRRDLVPLSQAMELFGKSRRP